MAQLVTVRLSKVDSQPWGFRLQGGKDFGTPLLLQKVNSGSIADKAGLVAGDAVIKVNNVELYNLRHKDAQDAIVRSGNSFELTIQRGGSTWKPSVTPVGNISSPVSSLGSVTPVTRTSLAATPQNVQHIGCGYNSAAQPFSNAGVKSIVNKQYNTPVGMYSDETIAETLSAQAEVLAGGVLGVNFKKNEKIYNAANSEVLKALNEQDNDPEPDGSTSFSPVSVAQSNSVTKHVFAPVDKPQTPSNGLPAGQNICSDCERLIVGVFVRIKDKNLHVECFKCATCGASLKNQGYYNINNKLYCDIHARIQAALSPPPNSNGMVPVTFPPKPVSASTISAALNAHAGNLNGSGASLPTQPSNFGGARPFGYTPSAAPKSPAMAPQSPSYPPTAPWSASKPANQPAPVISQSFGENNQGKTILFKPGNNMKAKSEAHDIQDLSDNELDILLYLKKPRAPQPGFTWPPKYEEEDEPTPTACPLYVPPPETQHAKTKSTIKNINIQSQSAPADLDHLESQQNVDIECCAESHASTSTTATHSSEEYQMYHTQCTQPISSSYIDKTSHQSLNYNVQVISNQKHQTEIDRKQSLCSAEVSRINSESSNKATAKPVKNFSDPRYELLYKKYYIDEEHLSRPATPTPKNVKKVEFAEPESTCIQSNLPPVRQIFKPSTTYSTVNQYQVYQNQNESQKDCSKPCAERSCEKACSDKSFDRPCEKPCARKLSMERVNQEVQLSDEQYEQEMEDHFHLTQYTHNIHYPNALTPNTVPKGYQSPMLKALITTSNKRYCLSPEPQPVEGIDDEILYDPFRDVMRELSKAEKEAEMAKRTAIEAEKEAKRRAEEQRLREENERRAHQLFPPKVEYSLTSSLRAASPLPFENRKILSKPEPISLPEPKEPYFPPPISMEPIRYDPIDYRSKSPMLDALTTASYVPFSPFKQDVISQMDEMPKVTQHLTMSSALVYAPDTAYSSFPVEIVDINAPPKPLELTLPPIEIPQIREPPKPQKEERFLEYQMDKQLSAFAKVKPIKPQDLERRNSQDESRSMKESNKVSTQNRSFHQQSIYEEQELSLKETSQGHKKSIIENARQMERKLARTRGKNSEGSSINPNLHKPDQIPTYQRKWYRLPTQNPPRTPEPVELKSNIPLAFIETESHPVVTTTSSCTNTPTCSTQDTKPPQFKQIPIIKTESDTQYNYGNNFVTIGESTDCDSICNETRLCGASTPTKMPTMGKSPTLLPYYQQQLAWEGGFAESHTFDPASGRTPSPCANRAKSPAFGPPPNPMLPHLPRSLDPSLNPSGTYLAGQKLDKPAWNLDTNFKMKSKSLGQQQQMFNLQSSKPNYTTYSNSECQSFQQKPDVCEQKQIGNTLVQSHMQQSQFNQQAHAEMESASSQQLGNVQVQRKTKIVEEFERTQSAKTVDIIKTSVNQSVSSELPSQGIVAAQMRRLSANGCDLVSDAFARFKVDSNQLSQTSISTGTPYQYFPTQAKPEPQQNKFPTQSFESPSKEDNQISKYSFPPQSPIEPPPGFGVTNKYMTNQLSSQMLSSNSRQFSETACKLPMAENNASCNKLPPSQNPIYQPTPFAGPAKPTPPSIISKPNKVENDPNPASAGPNKSAVGATTAPKRGRGVLNKAVVGGRTPLCGSCNGQVRGPFITALGRIWCPDHFICGNNSCKHPLADIGFVEEKGNLYCEYCFEQYLAPPCSRCNNKIKGDCLNAIGRKFHPECFTCTYCGKLFGNSPFFLEEGEAYCEVDWNELFTTKCFACGFPVEAGDKWVEALNNNYHSQCFNCTMCKKNLEGQSFYAKGGRPFCKNHAR